MKKCFKYITEFQDRREEEKQYYEKNRQDALKAELENQRIRSILKEKERLKNIFGLKVPDDLLIDIAYLEQDEKGERDYNYLKGGLRVALSQGRISVNDAIMIKAYVYDKYKEETIWSHTKNGKIDTITKK